ncbi:MAG: hypothetical protein JWL83_3544 [Actinomycetia bacterium]|nr:hypothetical protein [Actinomycetes bacterium]
MSRRTAVVLLAALLTTGLLTTVLLPGTSHAAPSASSIVDYIRKPGDQVVIVPNGVYSGGNVEAPHQQTGGRDRGWLVLQAQSQGGVTVDLAGAELNLGPNTSRVLFVGFKFINGSVRAYGHDIAFWYTDHTFPADVWSAQAPNPANPERGYYRAPRTVYVDKTSSHRVSFYGADVHDTGTAFMISGSRDLLLQGVHIKNLSDKGLDPHDVVHPDAIAGVAGNTRRLTVRDSWVQGRIVLEDGGGAGGSDGGPHRDVLFANSWVSNSPSVGFIFSSNRQTQPRGIFGRRVDVYSWGHHARADRIETIDGRRADQPNSQPNRINVVDEHVVNAPPPASMTSPPAAWRAAHPYRSWPQFLHLQHASAGSPVGFVVAGACGAVVLATILLVARRRRKRKSLPA